MATAAIEHYGGLQRVKPANGRHENPALKLTSAKLSFPGVNV